MSYYGLPRLEPGIRVTSEDAKQDLIKLTIGHWLHHGSEHTAMAIAYGMREEQYTNSEGEVKDLFREVQVRNNASLKLTFAKPQFSTGADGRTVTGKPLISGHIDFKCLNPGSLHPESQPTRDPASDPDNPDFNPSTYEITAELFLNPSRALNQLGDRAAYRVTRGGNWPDIPMFTTRDARRTSYESTCDGKDNAIILPGLSRVAREPHWQRFRDLYLREVDRFIDDRIGSQAVNWRIEAPTSRNPYYSMRGLEVYFEFQHDDPVGYMHQLGPAIRSIGRLESLRDYQISQDEDRNAPAYQIALAKGVKLAVYAKTTHRLRLEVRYTPKDITPPRLRGGGTKNYSAQNLFELSEVIHKYTVDATHRVNAVIDRLARANEEVPLGHTVQELIRAVVEACDDEYIASVLDTSQSGEPMPSLRRMRIHNHPWRHLSRGAEQAILPALVLRNAYATSDGDPFTPIITRLKKRGVVVSSGRRRYTLAPEYQAARETLATFYDDAND